MGQKWTTANKLACRDGNGMPARVYRQIMKDGGDQLLSERFVLGNGELILRNGDQYIRGNGEPIYSSQPTLP